MEGIKRDAMFIAMGIGIALGISYLTGHFTAQEIKKLIPVGSETPAPPETKVSELHVERKVADKPIYIKPSSGCNLKRIAKLIAESEYRIRRTMDDLPQGIDPGQIKKEVHSALNGRKCITVNELRKYLEWE